ncbi:hypothetical protein X961_5659 [Burkholderia pseudomallei MSHR5613]|nr:hypothetical protein X961_5659 [Burkholderia pseudomallei MSHR5613]KGX49899.1 hypothetical protein Y027_5625 [Burkholderia pseudomallei TSV5]KGX50294.1 hypothetical protein Y025_5425 [Burkholderia pseudomallei TSV32]
MLARLSKLGSPSFHRCQFLGFVAPIQPIAISWCKRKFVHSSEWNRTIRPFGKQRSSPPNSRAQMSFLWYENPRMRQIPDGCLLRGAALIRTPNFVRCLKWQLNLGELFHFWRCQSVRP